MTDSENKTTFKDKAIGDLKELFDLKDAEYAVENPREYAERIRNELQWYRSLLQYLEMWIELSNREIEGYDLADLDVNTTKQFWIKDNFYRTSYWRQRRSKVLERDNHKCYNCGLTQEEQRQKGETSRGLEVHHIKRRLSFSKQERKEKGEAHIMSNLVTLCTQCHATLEPKPAERQKEILDFEH